MIAIQFQRCDRMIWKNVKKAKLIMVSNFKEIAECISFSRASKDISDIVIIVSKSILCKPQYRCLISR